MVNLTPKSALYPEYSAGQYGNKSDHQLTMYEQRSKVMMNLVVFDQQAVDDVLQVKLKLELPDVGRAVSNDQTSILWIGPNRYLIVSHTDEGLKQVANVLPDECGAMQDLSSARTVIRIQGECARKVMAKGLAIDLSSAAFDRDQVILSSFDHHYPAIIQNVSSDQDTFDIYITRSFALSFWHWLTDSALEFGYQVEEPQFHGKA